MSSPTDHTEIRTKHRSRPRRWVIVLATVILVFVLAVVGDLMLIANRIDRVQVSFPDSGSGQTYVIVGSDSRESLPSGLTTDGLGTTTDVPGSRADIVLVLHVDDLGVSTILSVPRDLLVKTSSGGYTRLALTMTVGSQELVNSLCDTLNIPADHLIIFDFTSFISLIDEIDGVDVQIDLPVRDAFTGLNITETGLIHLDGVQSLALARSRQPETLQNGVWTPVADGAEVRMNSSGLIFAAVREKLEQQKWNPVRLQQLAWSLSGSLVTDSDTSLYNLLGLADLSGRVSELPAEGHDQLLALTANDATKQALNQAGFDQPCQR